jgi:thiamine transporter ThiT
VTIAAVTLGFTLGLVLGVIEVNLHLSIQSAFYQSFGQLFEQAVLACEVFGLAVVLEQFVEQLGRMVMGTVLRGVIQQYSVAGTLFPLTQFSSQSRTWHSKKTSKE